MERIVAVKAREQEVFRQSEPERVVHIDPHLYRILGHLHLLLENFPKGEEERMTFCVNNLPDPHSL